MRRALVILLLSSALVISACDSGKSNIAADNDEASAAQAEGVFDPMVSTLDRARQVQDMQAERSAEIDAAAEEAAR